MSLYLGPSYVIFVQFCMIANFLSYYFIVIALDRANAEEATLPIPKIFDLHEEKEDRHRSLSIDTDDVMADSIDHGNQSKVVDGKGRFSF